MPIFWETFQTDLLPSTDQPLAAGTNLQTLQLFYRIVDFERDPPPGVTNFGKIHVELWDASGDFKYEKCWAPI